jgi:hypothetical protein
LAALALLGPTAVLSGVLIGEASAQAGPAKQGVAVNMIVSRGHDLVTVLIKNRGPSPVCIDPSYAAPARISAATKKGAEIKSLNSSEGPAGQECARVSPGKTIHVVYDLRPLFPLGLPGDSRLCYASWWKQGGPDSRAPAERVSRCLVLPDSGIGRERG